MGLDMYLSATKYIGGGWSHVRNDYIRDPERKAPPTIVPKDPKPIAAVQFDAIIEALGLGTYAEFNERYPEGNSLTIEINVAYWRKANAIHQWFVDNVQGGVDECKPHGVGREQLTQLLQICETLLSTVDKGEPVLEKDFFGAEYTSYPHATIDVEAAKQALPSQSGFFFGSTEYDQWYIADLEHTVTQLTTILNDERLADFDFQYQSSW